MDELTLVRAFRADRGEIPDDARDRVRARLLTTVDAEPAAKPAARRTRRRRSLVLRVGTVGLALAAIVLGALSALPGSGPSTVARAAAALTGPEGAIAHIRAAATYTNPDGSTGTWQIETWQQSSPPFDSRQLVMRRGGMVRPESATADGVREFYDPRTNTIYRVPSPTDSAGKPAEEQGGASLDPFAPDFTVEKVRTLLTSGQAHEDGWVRVDGRDAIRIVSSSPEMTLLVDADTFGPIEWRVPEGDPPGQAVTMRFQTYEWLPGTEANVALTSLSAQHPDAVVRTAPIARARADAETK